MTRAVLVTAPVTYRELGEREKERGSEGTELVEIEEQYNDMENREMKESERKENTTHKSQAPRAICVAAL
jgi:hypothetical protein